jgi:hypothetical protein
MTERALEPTAGLRYQGGADTSRNGRKRALGYGTALVLAGLVGAQMILAIVVTGTSYAEDLKRFLQALLVGGASITGLLSAAGLRRAAFVTPLRIFVDRLEVPIPFPMDLLGLALRKEFAWNEIEKFEKRRTGWMIRSDGREFLIHPPFSAADEEWGDRIEAEIARSRLVQ